MIAVVASESSDGGVKNVNGVGEKYGEGDNPVSALPRTLIQMI